MLFKIALGCVSIGGAACAVGVPAHDWGGWYSWENGASFEHGFNSGAYPCPNMSGYKRIQTMPGRLYPYGKLDNGSFKFFDDIQCKGESSYKVSSEVGNCKCVENNNSEEYYQQVKLIDGNESTKNNNCFCQKGEQK